MDGRYRDIYELSMGYWQGLGYRPKGSEEYSFLSFDKGKLKKNTFSSSFEEAYKLLVIYLAKGSGAPVTNLHICFSLPWAILRKNEIRSVRTMIKAFKEHIEITLGYQVQTTRGPLP